MAQNEVTTRSSEDLSRLVLIKSGRRWGFSWGNGDEAALLSRVDDLSRAPWSGLDRADATVIRHEIERAQSGHPIVDHQ